jgi:hypothetical protein
LCQRGRCHQDIGRVSPHGANLGSAGLCVPNSNLQGDQSPRRAGCSVKPFVYKGESYTNLIVNENYSVAEVAEQWGISTDLVRDTFKDEPGVVKICAAGLPREAGIACFEFPNLYWFAFTLV